MVTDSLSCWLSSEHRDEFAGRPFIRPQIAIIQPGTSFAGKSPKAAALFDELLALTIHDDKSPFGWQQWLTHEIMRERDRTWASRHFAICVPRQNGKGDVLESRELLGILAAGDKKVLHTAHNLETAEDAFARMVERIEKNPHLSQLDLKVTNTNGRKRIEFKGFGYIDYRTRSRPPARGLQYDLIVIDEAMTVTGPQISSMLPTQATRDRPQMIYAFTGLFADSDHMHELRKKITEAGQPTSGGFSWVEWSLPEGEDPDDMSWAVRTNPSMMDGLITVDVAEGEKAGMSSIEDYARERLNAHEFPADAVAVITAEALDQCEDFTATHGPRIVLGVHVAKNLSRTWIAAASHLADGQTMIEIIEARDDTWWIVDWLKEALDENNITDPIYLSSVTASGILAKRFERVGIEYADINARDWVKAVNGFLDEFNQNKIVHIGQPELTTSLVGARLDDRGQGRIWSWEHSQSELGPTVAVTHAYAGLVDVTSKPQKRIAIPRRAAMPRNSIYPKRRSQGQVTQW